MYYDLKYSSNQLGITPSKVNITKKKKKCIDNNLIINYGGIIITWDFMTIQLVSRGEKTMLAKFKEKKKKKFIFEVLKILERGKMLRYIALLYLVI